MLVGLWQSNGVFAPSRLVSTDSGGATYQSFIPYDIPLRLSVASKSVQLSVVGAAAGGAAVDATAGWNAPMRIAAGTAAPVVQVFRVEGSK